MARGYRSYSVSHNSLCNHLISFSYFILKFELLFLILKVYLGQTEVKSISRESPSFYLTKTVFVLLYRYLNSVSSPFLSAGSFLSVFKCKHLPPIVK